MPIHPPFTPFAPNLEPTPPSYILVHQAFLFRPVRRFGSVNRKALDQYTSFTEQREELQQRKAELDRSEAKIRELINVSRSPLGSHACMTLSPL